MHNGKSSNDFLLFVNSCFSLIDFNIRNRRETEVETERIRSSQTAAERALEAREKSHRARVKGLEDQVNQFLLHFLFFIFRICRSLH